jgi:hypothetical protein
MPLHMVAFAIQNCCPYSVNASCTLYYIYRTSCLPPFSLALTFSQAMYVSR